MRLTVKRFETKKGEAGNHDGALLVWATHPDAPNFSGNARGRCIHLERDDDKFPFPSTFCGMRAVEYTANTGRKLCVNCQIIQKRERMDNEFKQVIS